ncbi:TlpA family protein disulfide reductase [Xylanibacillus composti]|nr:TlpA family protein disulfide reductase [Xylanibacillus composti]
MHVRNLAVMLVIVALVGVAVYQNVISESAALPTEEAPKQNFLAPSFSAETMSGDEIEIGGARDKALLLNFWAAWCHPCHTEAPDLAAFADKYKDDLDIVAVNVTNIDDLDNARDFVDEYGFTFPIPLDPKGDIQKLYNVYSYPTTFLVNRDGVIRHVILGIRPPNDLERMIKDTIKG